jgi:XTP/dITP diphosphohydrolase
VKLLVATRSAHKMKEIRRILSPVSDLEVLDPDAAGVAPSPEEDGLEPFDTFEENAASKARWFHARTGLPTVADDSGLEVDALTGAPGVRSKRFAPDRGFEGEARDRENNAHLVERLAGVAPAERTARYVCVAVLIEADGKARTFRGEAPGLILDHPRGRGGFGYDPHFLDPELDRTFAEISREKKNARSHRGAAFRALARHLQERGQQAGGAP